MYQIHKNYNTSSIAKSTMGNQEGKNAQPKNDANSNNNNAASPSKNHPDQSPQKNIDKQVPRNEKSNNIVEQRKESGGVSALDNYKERIKNSKRNSPDLIDNNPHLTPSYRATPIPSSLSNVRPGNPGQNSLYGEEEDENEFMPLLRLAPAGEVRLHITLIELVFERSNKSCLRKNNSVYNSVMTWKKNNNIFNFVLKEDQNYELVMDVDLQGTTINNKDEQWSVLCPINIPIGDSVKVGQMTCVNWYSRLENDAADFQQNQLGPSIKNIDFKISEQTFGKWGEKVPKNFYDESNSKVLKKVFQKVEVQKFVAYKQISRYFDSKNSWRASTFVEETSRHFRGWIIEVTDHNSVASISKQLHQDLKNREAFYTKYMFDREFGVVTEQEAD